jgi:cell division protein FtsW (lipid II flippase)
VNLFYLGLVFLLVAVFLVIHYSEIELPEPDHGTVCVRTIPFVAIVLLAGIAFGLWIACALVVTRIVT